MEGHLLLIKRILLGVVILAVIIIVGYAVYAFYISPSINYGEMPKTTEQKLKVLEDLSKEAGTTTVTTSEKEKILNSLIPSATQNAPSGSKTGVAPDPAQSVASPDLQSQEVQDKIKLLESLQNKTQ